MDSRRLPLRFVAPAVAVIAADLATKWVVYRSMTLGAPPLRVIGDWVRLTYIHNSGAAFGLFQGSRWFFVGISSLSVVVILALATSGRYRDRGLLVAFGLILGGAIGNLTDRLWLGVVIDFVQVGVAGRYWPVFNLADVGVTSGVGLLALRLLRDGRPAEPAGTGTGDGPPEGGGSGSVIGTPEGDGSGQRHGTPEGDGSARGSGPRDGSGSERGSGPPRGNALERDHRPFAPGPAADGTRPSRPEAEGP